MKRKNMKLLRAVALVLALVLMMPTGARAALPETVQPNASNLLYDYNAWLVAKGSGVVEVHFTAEGMGTLYQLGVETITLYQSIDSQNWFFAESWTYETTMKLTSYNVSEYTNSVSHSGYPGRFYKATVTFYGELGGAWETKEFNIPMMLST